VKPGVSRVPVVGPLAARKPFQEFRRQKLSPMRAGSRELFGREIKHLYDVYNAWISVSEVAAGAGSFGEASFGRVPPRGVEGYANLTVSLSRKCGDLR
jgi:hypothetical protein